MVLIHMVLAKVPLFIPSLLFDSVVFWSNADAARWFEKGLESGCPAGGTYRLLLSFYA